MPLLEVLTLGHMRPVLALNDTGDCCSADAKLIGQRSVGDASAGVPLANLGDLRFIQFGLGMRAAAALALLINHVAHVVGGSTDKQVGGVDAPGVVAMMANVHALRDRTEMQLIAKAMGKRGSAIDMDLAMLKRKDETRPLPAGVWAELVHLFPEAFFGRAFAVVPMHKPNGLPLDPSTFFVVVRRKWGGLTAAAFAEFNGRGVRGMLVHVVSASSAIGHAAGRFQRRCGASIGELHYTTTDSVPQLEAR